MNVREYIDEKYRDATAKSITSAEARIFGIPYPLKSGWLDRHGDVVVTQEMARRVIQAFLVKRKKRSSEFKVAAIPILVSIAKGEVDTHESHEMVEVKPELGVEIRWMPHMSELAERSYRNAGFRLIDFPERLP